MALTRQERRERLACRVYECAARDLGRDLEGGSLVDLLIDRMQVARVGGGDARRLAKIVCRDCVVSPRLMQQYAECGRRRETFALMLRAEQREYTSLDIISKTYLAYPTRDVWGCITIVDLELFGMRNDEHLVGEHNPTTDYHYLAGPRYDPLLDPEHWRQ